MPEKLSPRMRTYYILIVAVIVLFSFGAIAGLLYLLEGLGVIPSLGIYTLISLLLVSGITVALMSYFIGRRVLTPLVKLSSASKEVARGNFDVTVSDSSKMEEVQTTFRNFNAMVRELAATDTLQTDFISSVSHEFKTPIGAIEGYTQLLQDHQLTDAERDAYVDKILCNTARLSSLVGNILLLSKIDNRSVTLTKSRYRLDEQIRQVIVAAENKWGEKEIDFDVDLAEVLWSGHETLLYHVWSNLLDNAVKFSPRGGTVRMRLWRNEAGVTFTVSDEGPGIPAGEEERIFAKFYQGDTSHESEGNGLGLALVRTIVSVHGGTVKVTPATSLFTVFLPE